MRLTDQPLSMAEAQQHESLPPAMRLTDPGQNTAP